jgi:polyhydroxybutyrate depolymerase
MLRTLIAVLLSLVGSVAFADTGTLHQVTWQPSPTLPSQTRFYTVYRNPAISPATPTPLVVMLHGHGGTGASFEDVSGMTNVAKANNFTVVYPWAKGTPPNTAWDTYTTAADNDVRFIDAVVGWVQQDFALLPKRLYAVAHSQGAGIVEVIGCARSPYVAAIADVSQNLSTTLQGLCNTELGKVDRAVPAILFHGDADPISPFPPEGNLLGAIATATFWRDRNNCAVTAPDQLYAVTLKDSSGTLSPSTARLQTWQQCTHNATVQNYILYGGGHGWPGAAYTPTQLANLGPVVVGVPTSQIIWSFLNQHSLP